MPRTCASFAVVGCLAAIATANVAVGEVVALGAELQVNSYTTGKQYAVAVAAGSNSAFVVVWESVGQDGAVTGVFGRRYSSAGATLASEFQVNAYTTYGQDDPSVAAEVNGDFVVAWSSYGQDGSFTGIFARRFSSAGAGLASEFQVNTYTTGSEGSPVMDLDNDGDFVVAWTSFGQDGSNGGIFARRFSSAGAALGGELQVNTYTTSFQTLPSIASDSDGDFVVAWQSLGQDGSFNGVFARRFSSAGAALASEFQVSTYTSSEQEYLSVAADADGDFVVAWTSAHAGGLEVFARRFSSAGVAFGIEFQVNIETALTQAVPSVAADADGDFVVAWQTYGQEGDGGWSIFARRFSSAGASVTEEFKVNTFTPGYQIAPSVASNGDGRFVVAWESYKQDGDNYAIVAQRFATVAVLDIDGNGSTAALTDGLLVLRFLFGFTGSTLTTGAVDLAGCTRCDAQAIAAYLQTLV